MGRVCDMIGLYLLLCAHAAYHSPTDTLNSLAAELRQAQAENIASYQKFLRQAYHVTVEALDGREWTVVSPALKAQKFRFEDKGTAGTSHRYNLRLDRLAFRP